MCIIALKPEKVQFSKSQLKVMWDNNPDGAGFMYAQDGKVHIVKGLMTLDALWDAIQQVGPLRKLVIHFRIRTHGAVSKELTHPFWIREGELGMVHNGVIRELVNETSEAESDTAVFARKFGEAYNNPLLAVKHDFHRAMLEAYIGYSKMVFMDGTGATYILNENLGEWHKNVWYSNSNYKAEKSWKTEYWSSMTRGIMGENVEFPWERGKFEQSAEERAAIQARLEEAFRIDQRTDRGGNRKNKGKGSENAQKRRQRPLLGCPTTQVTSRWVRTEEREK
jgi:predicted glutamine amidotransferase